MSIIYPEAKASIHPKAEIRNGLEGAASALFPGDAANLYRRNAAAARGPSAKLAWVAAPIAFVLIGGGVLMAMPHAKTVPSATSTVSRTTVAPAGATTIAPTSAAKAMTQAAQSEAVKSSEQITRRRPLAAHTVRLSRSTTSHAAESRTLAAAPALPTAPQPYAATQTAAQPGASLGSTVASPPASQLAPQSQAPTTPTPGDFQFTAPPKEPAATSATVSPAPAVTQPSISNPQAPSQPQG